MTLSNQPESVLNTLLQVQSLFFHEKCIHTETTILSFIFSAVCVQHAKIMSYTAVNNCLLFAFYRFYYILMHQVQRQDSQGYRFILHFYFFTSKSID